MLLKVALGSVLLFGLLGCSSGEASGPETAGSAGATGDGDGDGDEQVLQLCSWWTAPGAADALTVLRDTYKNVHEGSRVYHYSDVTAGTIKDVLGKGLPDSQFDVFQLSAVDLPWLLNTHGDTVEKLDSVYADA